MLWGKQSVPSGIWVWDPQNFKAGKLDEGISLGPKWDGGQGFLQEGTLQEGTLQWDKSILL